MKNLYELTTIKNGKENIILTTRDRSTAIETFYETKEIDETAILYIYHNGRVFKYESYLDD